MIRRNISAAFSIVELVIVVAVVAILATITVVGYNSVTQNAREKTLLSDLSAVVSEVTRYGTNNGGKYNSAIEWFSGSGSQNQNINFTPSTGNIIDVVSQGSFFCVRVYNPTVQNHAIISTAVSEGADENSCTLLGASSAAGGTTGKLVGWWKLNGDALDSSGNGNHGDVRGPVLTMSENGASNGAYSFDGVDDYIALSGDGLTSVGEFTLSAWARIVSGPGTNGGYSYVLHRSVDVTIGNSVYWFGTTVDPFYAWGVSGLNTGAVTTIPGSTVTWRHLALVYDSTNATLYVDGAVAGSYARPPITTNTSGNSFTIGGTSLAPVNRAVLGDIDDVRVYDTALDVTAVQQLHSAGAQ